MRVSASLVCRLALSEREAAEIPLAMLRNRAAHLADEREMLGEERAPIANCEMNHNSEPPAEREPIIHPLRQEVAHVLTRGSDCLDEGN